MSKDGLKAKMWRRTHNTLLEALRILLGSFLILVLAAVTIPWRLLRGRQP